MAEPGGFGGFKLMNRTVQEEESFDYTKYRNVPKPTGPMGSVMHLVKGALGAGILGGHVAYMKAGVMFAVPMNIVFGTYICYCFYTLVKNAQVLFKRSRVPSMTYPDMGECALSCYPNKTVNKFAKCFRFFMDFVLCLELYGACAAYQIIIAKSIKQLVEGTQRTSLDGLPGYPGLRIYLAGMIIPLIIICLIRHLKYLAPFSLVANCIILFSISLTIYYSRVNNPNFENLVHTTDWYNTLQFIGINIFSMSCAGVVIPVEQNMRNPRRYPLILCIGMTLITTFVFLTSFFGYVAYLDECESPITVNFPMTMMPKILKGLMAVMIFITHALNFWVPFSLCFVYIKRKYPPEKHVRLEYIFRPIFVILVSTIAIIFPNINALMGFLGAFCLSHMAFLWPFIIEFFVVMYRPGFGYLKWRLWKFIFFMIIGNILMVCAGGVNLYELLSK